MKERLMPSKSEQAGRGKIDLTESVSNQYAGGMPVDNIGEVVGPRTDIARMREIAAGGKPPVIDIRRSRESNTNQLLEVKLQEILDQTKAVEARRMLSEFLKYVHEFPISRWQQMDYLQAYSAFKSDNLQEPESEARRTRTGIRQAIVDTAEVKRILTPEEFFAFENPKTSDEPVSVGGIVIPDEKKAQADMSKFREDNSSNLEAEEDSLHPEKKSLKNGLKGFRGDSLDSKIFILNQTAEEEERNQILERRLGVLMSHPDAESIKAQYIRQALEQPSMLKEEVRERIENERGSFNPRSIVFPRDFNIENLNLAAHISSYYDQPPSNIEELAWQISVTDIDKWGIDGDFPLLEHVKVDSKGDPVEDGFEGRVIDRVQIREEHFLRWINDRMWFYHNEAKDDQQDFFTKVGLRKMYRPLSVAEMIDDEDRYFASGWKVEDGKAKKYLQISNQMRRDVWTTTTARNDAIVLTGVMGFEDKVAEQYMQMAYLNFLTKTVWNGESTYFHIKNSPYKMKEGTYFDENTQDNLFGGAINMAELLYYHIGDYSKLLKILGGTEDNLPPMLTIQGIKDAILHEAGSPEKARTFIKPTEYMKLISAPTGSAKEKENIIEFLNVFNAPQKDGRVVRVTERLIQEAISKQFGLMVKSNTSNRDEAGNKIQRTQNEETPDGLKGRFIKLNDGKYVERDLSIPEHRNAPGYDIDSTYAGLAQTRALHLSVVTLSSVRGDTKGIGYNKMTGPAELERYRTRQFSGERGAAAGNPYSLHMFKRLTTDLLTGTRTEIPSGFNLYGEGGELSESFERPIDVMWNMHEAFLRGGYVNGCKDAQVKARDLIFPENTWRTFALDHISRGFDMYKKIKSAHEFLRLDKFAKYDFWNGYTFDRAEFQKAVSDNLITPVRYLLSTWPMLDYSKTVNVQVGKVFKDIPLGEAMFGHELLDIPEFWMLNDHGKPMKDENGRRRIDYHKIQANKEKLFKQVIAGFIATELYSHRDRASADMKFDHSFYNQVYGALLLIPNQILGDEFDMQGSKAEGSFFTGRDIEWMRKKSNTGKSKLLATSFFIATFKGTGKGFEESFGSLLKLIFS